MFVFCSKQFSLFLGMAFLGTHVFAAVPSSTLTAHSTGAQEYAMRCAGCHGLDGLGNIKGPAIARQPGTVARPDKELVRIVRNGVPGKGMPSMKRLGDAKIIAVVQYLRTLQSASSGGSGSGAVGSASGNAGSASGTSFARPAPANAPAKADFAIASAAPGEMLAMKEPAGVDHAALRAFHVTQADLNQKLIGENWVSYNGDYSGRRFSTMSEVKPANASQLVAKWHFKTTGAGVMEVTPVVVAGVMFVTRSNDAWALDAKTGKLLWHHARAVSDGLIDDAARHINRGVAVLGARVYMETDNAHLLCLDARTGEQIWDIAYATGNRNYGATSAPLIVKDKVIVGTSGGDEGVRGFVAAYDAQTGKQVWRFWTIPAPGEKGNDSWPGDMYLHGGEPPGCRAPSTRN
jgi:outer membrane protein assembly factor BamB